MQWLAYNLLDGQGHIERTRLVCDFQQEQLEQWQQHELRGERFRERTKRQVLQSERNEQLQEEVQVDVLVGSH